MSVQAMSWVIDNSTARGTSLLVLIMVANHAHADGTGAWPSYATLAREARFSVRTVKRLIAELEAGGHVTIERGGGRNRVNVYKVEMGNGAILTPFPAVETVSESVETVSNPVGNGVTHDTQTNYEPSIEPSSTAASRRRRAFDALCIAGGWDPGALSPSAERTVAVKLAEVRVAMGEDVEWDDIAAEIPRRAERYRHRHPTWSLTVSALAKHWPELGPERVETPAVAGVPAEWLDRCAANHDDPRLAYAPSGLCEDCARNYAIVRNTERERGEA